MPHKRAWEDTIQPRLKDIDQWLRQGVSLKDVYGNLRLSKNAWFVAVKQHPELDELVKAAIKAGKDNYYGDINAAKSALEKAACGYDKEEVKRTYLRNEDGEMVLVQEQRTMKHYPSSARALEYLLNNADPTHYQSKQEVTNRVQLNPKDIAALDLSQLTDEELAELADSDEQP